MEPHSTQLSPRGRLVRSGALALALLGSTLAGSGCKLTESMTTTSAASPTPEVKPEVSTAPRSGKVCQVVAAWSNKVQYAPDPANNGVPGAGLVGRLYLFGESIGFPLTGEGTVFVELFDESQGVPGGTLIEQWTIDPVTLQKLYRQDTIGWGYTLFLPWGSYRPDLSKVRLTCRFTPNDGSTPLYAPISSLTVNHTASPLGSPAPVANGGPVLPPSPVPAPAPVAPPPGNPLPAPRISR